MKVKKISCEEFRKWIGKAFREELTYSQKLRFYYHLRTCRECREITDKIVAKMKVEPTDLTDEHVRGYIDKPATLVEQRWMRLLKAVFPYPDE